MTARVPARPGSYDTEPPSSVEFYGLGLVHMVHHPNTKCTSAKSGVKYRSSPIFAYNLLSYFGAIGVQSDMMLFYELIVNSARQRETVSKKIIIKNNDKK